MLTIGLLLIFLTGFLLIKRISTEFSLCESLGFAFPLGLGMTTFLMFLFDWVGIPLTPTANFCITVLIFLITFGFAIPKRREIVTSLRPNRDFSWFNFVWLVCLVILVYAEYSNWMKTMYFPAYDRDSMAGFDTIGFVASQEHTYRNLSIFDGNYMPKIHQAGSYITYMPMTQLAYAFVYSLQAASSKIIPALFFLSFLLGFYGVTKRATSRTAAMFATLGVVFAPELLSFSSLSNTNVLQACMASSGLIYFCLWFKRPQQLYLMTLGSLLLAENCWIRAEGFIFIITAFVLVIIRLILDRKSFCAAPRKSQVRLILTPLLSFLPLLAFTVYAHLFGLTAESVVIAHPFWDAIKAKDVAGIAPFLMFSSGYYGWTFEIALVALLIDFPFIIRYRDSLHTLLTLFISIVLYLIILYQINYVWDSLENVLNYSAKRFWFCFVPLTWFFTVSSHTVKMLFQNLEDALSLHIKL